MKTFKYGTLVLMLLSAIVCKGQNPEQEKAAAEIEAMMAEMQRKADSIRNDPEVKKRTEEAMKILAAEEVKQEKRLAEENKSAQKETASRSNTDHLKDFTISKGTAKKFDNWQFGAAELYLFKYLPFGKDPKSEHKVGSIDADGSFDFTMPENMAGTNTIAEVFKCGDHESPTESEYSDPNVGVVSQSISVIQNGERIGKITLATSREQVYNYSPMYIHSGHPGYRMNWWYAEGASSAKVLCDRMYDYRGEQLEMRIIYDLQFKPGWNLVKNEMLEAHNPYLYKTKKFSVVPALPSDAKWVFQEIRL